MVSSRLLEGPRCLWALVAGVLLLPAFILQH